MLNHATLSRVIHEFPVMLMGIAPDRTLVSLNEVAAQALDVKSEDWLGKRFSLAEWFDQKEYEDLLDSMLENPADEDLRVVLSRTTAHDEIRHYRFLLRCRKESLHGEVALWLIGENFTEEFNLQARLAEAENRFHLISRATNDAVWDWDIEKDALWWGDGLQELFGYPEGGQETTFEWWADRIHPDDREQTANSLTDAAKNGAKLWVAEYRFRRKDGSYAYVNDRGWTVFDSDRKAIRIIGGMLDITERKIHENNLMVRNQQLTEYSFYNSHKLRAPLARLLLGVELLNGDQRVHPEIQELIDTIRNSAMELDGVIRDINRILSSGRGN